MLQVSGQTTTSKIRHWQILIVEHNFEESERCALALKGEGYAVRTAATAVEALDALRQHPADLVITNLALPQTDGMQLLARVREMYPETNVIVMTHSGDVEQAIEAMRRGAAEFLIQPFAPQDLKKIAASSLTAIRASQDHAFLQQSNAMMDLWQLLSNTGDVQALPGRAVELARRSFEADSAVLLNYDVARDSLSMSAHAGDSLNRWGLTERMSALGLECIHQKRVALSTDVSTGDCFAFVPLVLAERPRGALGLRRAGGPWFHEKSVDLLHVFASHLALALEAVRLYDLAAQQVVELEEMVSASRSLAFCHDAEKLCAQLLTGVQRATGAEICAALVMEAGVTRVFTLPEIPDNTDLGAAIRRRLLAVSPMCNSAFPTRQAGTETRQKLRSFISAEMQVQGRRYGVVGAFSSRAEGFALEEARKLSTLAESAAAAQDNQAQLSRITVLYHETLNLLGTTVDTRCPQNLGHSNQVRTFAGALAQAVGMNGADLYRIEDGALLHDIGKVQVPDSLLSKPGKLAPDEFAIVAAHPVYGAQMLAGAPHLHDLIPIVRHHHERYDGTGYPDGLRGDMIPVGARIVALGDVFDALVSHRVYRPALPVEEARRLLAAQAGAQFDPHLVRAFLGLPLESLIEH